MEDVTFVILDTDILIGLLRGKRDILRQIKLLDEKDAIFATTSINEFELYYGAYKSKFKKENLRSVRALLQNLEILPFVYPATEIAGRIFSELSKEGKLIEVRDLFIASIAIATNGTLLTSNVKHFKRINGLKLISLSDV
ncbi:MAG: type II toxin-antitoxin system VapC family toxin [Candidatus Asgardarchaeia archaeon]